MLEAIFRRLATSRRQRRSALCVSLYCQAFDVESDHASEGN
jgi:hypothetical protein